VTEARHPPMSYDAIPAELRKRRQWVIWREEQRDGKRTKVPYRPANPSVKASSTNQLAQSIVWAISQPSGVDINTMIVRPTGSPV
jgi:NADP-dependent 3-hydroxy acid dehydrogenase YdfG